MVWTRRQSVIFMAVAVFIALAGALSFRFIYAQEVGPKSCITKAECPADQYCIANRCNVPPPVWNGEGIAGFAPQAASFSITGGGAFGGFSPDPQWRVTTPSIYIGGGAGQAGTTIKDGKIVTDSDLMVKGLVAAKSDIIAVGKIATLSDAIVTGKLLRSDQLTEHGDPDYYFKASSEITINPQGLLEIGTIPAAKISGLPSGGVGGSVDECSVSIFKNASAAISSGFGNGYTGVNAKCGAGQHVCTTDEVIKSLRCHVSMPASGSMWVIEGPPGYTAAANDCMGWQSNSASHYGAYWDFGGSVNGGVGWMTVCSSELPFACCQ